MKCSGKCYLKKQLNKIEEQDEDKKNSPLTILQLKTVDNFIVQQYPNHNYSSSFTALQQNCFLHYNLIEVEGYLTSLFRPPKFI